MISKFFLFLMCYVVLASIVFFTIAYFCNRSMNRRFSIDSKLTKEYGSDWYDILTEEIYANPKCMSNNSILKMHKRLKDSSYVHKWNKKDDHNRNADIILVQQILDKRY